MIELRAESFWKQDALLGEGPCWDSHQQKLLWVDILRHQVHRYDMAENNHESWQVDSEVGFALPDQQGKLICGTRQGLIRFDTSDGSQQLLADPEAALTKNRFNDGKCDPQGRLWAGTLSDERQPIASLWRFDAQQDACRMLEKVTVSNGLAWSCDGQTMYYIDSPTFRVDAFDFDSENGMLANRRPVIHVPEAMGKPDGMTIDHEGMLWVALFRGGAVARWDPSTGDLLALVKVPASQTTSCCFGGEDGKTLFITTARVGLTDEQLTEQPQAGHLFAIEPGVSGPATVAYRG